ncbi:hypothetical protein LCGC14_0944900 [marine sediment metagenome]|uniref:Uncharacterized protein n=1 Tax=marine sediment metagenome TaxID=412755 RepID=A0A0F9RQD6_9ZZZZ
MTVACFPQFLALDITGQPHRWISYQQAAKYYAVTEFTVVRNVFQVFARS